jgi:hypothetical protein
VSLSILGDIETLCQFPAPDQIIRVEGFSSLLDTARMNCFLFLEPLVCTMPHMLFHQCPLRPGTSFWLKSPHTPLERVHQYSSICCSNVAYRLPFRCRGISIPVGYLPTINFFKCSSSSLISFLALYNLSHTVHFPVPEDLTSFCWISRPNVDRSIFSSAVYLVNVYYFVGIIIGGACDPDLSRWSDLRVTWRNGVFGFVY